MISAKVAARREGAGAGRAPAVVLALLLAGGAGCGDPAMSPGDLDGGTVNTSARWRPLQMAGRTAMASLGGRVIRFGGGPADSITGNETWEWTGGFWKRLVPATSPPARAGHAMATLGDRIILFGGLGDEGPLGDTWAWDGTTWHPLNVEGPQARHAHAMAALGDQIILFGGYRETGAFGDTWAWSGTAWTLLSPPNSPSPVGRHALARRADRLVLFGGDSAPPDTLTGRGELWEWDGTTWIDRSTQTGPLWRKQVALATMGELVVVFGGDVAPADFGPQPTYDTWLWNGDIWIPIRPPKSPSQRFGAAAAAVDGRVLLFGGVGISGDLGDTWSFDGKDWVEQDHASAPTARIELAMARLGDKVVVFGGAGRNGLGQDATLGDTWEWNGVAFTQRTPNTSPPLRRGHAMATLGDKVVLFGGTNDSVFFGDTWEWDGTNWTRRFSPSTPSPRSGHAMATLGNKVFLFGGELMGKTWAWDGSVWTDVSPLKSPRSRLDPAMATLKDQIIMFGGFRTDELNGEIATTYLDETWGWDGAAWTRLSPLEAPSPRSGMEMATLDDRIFLFGGERPGGALNDTWIWDRGIWTQARMPKSASMPSAQANGAMAALDGTIILVGGGLEQSVAGAWLLR